jgi:hypothetical protein
MSATKTVKLGEVDVTDISGKPIGKANLIAFSRWKVSRIRVCGAEDINISQYPLEQWINAFINHPNPKAPFCFDKLGTEMGLGAPGFVTREQVIEKIQPLLKVNEFKDVHEAIVAATEFLKKL